MSISPTEPGDQSSSSEAALRESENRYRQLVELSPNAIVIYRQGELSFVNSRAVTMSGAKGPEELIGRAILDFVRPDYHARVLERVRQMTAEAVPVPATEIVLLRLDGTPIEAEVMAVSLGAYEPDAVEAIIRNISDQKRAARRLQRYELLAEHAHESMMFTDLDGRIIEANRAAALTYGMTRDELLTKFMFDLMAGDAHGLTGATKTQAYRDGITFESSHRRKDGRVFPVDVSLVGADVDGRPALLGIVRDITERKRAEHELATQAAELRTLSHRLVEAQESERRFVAKELHDEVGQMLTALKLVLDALARRPGGASAKDLADPLAMVDGLMNRIRNLSLDLRPTMLDDLGLLPALLWHFDRFATLTGVRVHFEHSGLDRRRFPSAIETAAYRIIQEALTNTARYSGQQSAVVRLRADERALALQVQDAGVGFDPQDVLSRGGRGGVDGDERACYPPGWQFEHRIDARGWRVSHGRAPSGKR